MLFYLLEYARAEQGCTGKVCFSWAFGAIVGPENNQELIGITRDTELKSGDLLKMRIQLNQNCFVYVFYYSSKGELYMMFPYNLSQFLTDYKVSKKYYIPKGSFALELDESVGLERFYLIASNQRLSELEHLYRSYESAETLKKPKFIESIIDEIKLQKKRHKKLTTTAERPHLSLGPVRAQIVNGKKEFPELDKFAVQINAENFFAKTFTIDHR